MAPIETSLQPPNGEWKRTVLAALSLCLLLCSYYILRPVRDAMAVQIDENQRQWLFTGTFIYTLAVVPIFGWMVKRFSRAVLIPVTFGLMISMLIGFYVLFSVSDSDRMKLVSYAAFFIWLSMFNVLIVSVFWSAVSDAFSTDQAQRFYGYITAGGTAGAILGPITTLSISQHTSTPNLLLVSAGILFLALLMILQLGRLAETRERKLHRPLGGSILAGVTQTVRSPVLSQLAGLVICYSTVSTVLYLEMANLVGKEIPKADQTAFFSRIDLAVNVLALIVQLLATRFVLNRLGVNWALAVAPAAMLIGLTMFGIQPAILLLAVVQVAHRASEFALTRPGREVLFTTVDAESRYKAKNFIDTAVYRANDSASAWLITAVRSHHLNVIWVVGVPVTLAWLVLSRRIGRSRIAARDPAQETVSAS